MAHAVYSPEQRRPVEVDAAHEDQLIAWLSKRMGAPMKPPHLQAVGYALEGGRLLPGGQGPVAQFMYRDEAGSRLTLYVSNEVGDLAAPAGTVASTASGKNVETAFRQRKDSAGKTIPAWFIQEVNASHHGKPVLTAQWGPSIAKNPFLQFVVNGAKAGDKIAVSWIDKRGDKRGDEATVS